MNRRPVSVCRFLLQCLLLGDGEQRAQVIGELLEEPQELQQLVLHAYGNFGKVHGRGNRLLPRW